MINKYYEVYCRDRESDVLRFLDISMACKQAREWSKEYDCEVVVMKYFTEEVFVYDKGEMTIDDSMVDEYENDYDYDNE